MRWRNGIFRRTATVVSLVWLLCLGVGAHSALAATDSGGGARTVAATVASVVRLSGADRYATAVAISQHGWSTSKYVVVVTGQNYPDALAAGPLAKAYNAPVLLTTKTSLPSVVVAEIHRLKAKHAIVVGSTASVGSGAFNKLKALLGKKQVERISGSDRYRTAANIAARLKSKKLYGGHIVVVSGATYYDAFAVSGFAAQKRYPILLVAAKKLPAITKSEISKLHPKSTIVVGTTARVSDAVLRKLPRPTRVTGTDDFTTAWAVADYAAANGSSYSQIAIASNYSYGDVLAGGAFTARIGGVYLLTPPNTLCSCARQAMLNHLSQILSVHILGNEASFYASTKAEIEALLSSVNAVPWSAQRLMSAGSPNYYVRDLDAKVGPDGGLNLLWFDGDKLYLRKLDAKGNTVISPILVPMSPRELAGYGESYPRIAVGPDGRITVIWRFNPATQYGGTWAVQYDAAGRYLQGPMHLGTVAPRFLDVSTDANGDIHITGRDALSRPTYTRLTADLHVRIPWTPLTTMSRSYFTRLEAIGVRPDGTDELAWFDCRDFSTYGYYQLYHSRLTWGSGVGHLGTGSIDQAKITNVPGGFYAAEAGADNYSGNSWQPGTSIGPDGSMHLAWMSDGSSVWYERLDSAGHVATPARKVLDVGHAQDFTPYVDVAARGDGGADLVFTYLDAGQSAQRLGHLVVGSDGTSLTPVTRIEAATARPWYFALQRNSANLQLIYAQTVNTNYQRVYYGDTLRDGTSFDGARCDLVVDDAHSTNSTWPREGQSVTMTMLVGNHGWVASPGSTAVFSYLGVPFATVAVPPLAVDATTSVSATWVVPANFNVATPMMSVTVDPSNAIAETSEANNTVQHPVPVHLRPAWVNIEFVGMDETFDPTHSLGYYQADHIRAALVGTRSENPTGTAYAQTVDVTGTAAAGVLVHVPPGKYLLSYVCTDYAAPYSPVSVEVTRSAGDPYVLTITPNDGFIECWVNTWGTLGGKVWNDNGTPSTGDDVGLSAAKVTIAETGDTTTTAANGSFAFARMAAGTYHITVEKDSFRRSRGTTATVTVGGNPDVQVVTGATTKAYVDASILGPDAGGIADATAEIRNASNSTLLSATTDREGAAYFEVDSGSPIHLHGSAPFYVQGDGSAFTPVAGRSYAKSVTLAVDTSLINRTSSDWSTWSVYTDYFRFEHDESTTSYRNFKTHFNIDWVNDSGAHRIVAVHAWAHGLAFMTDQLKVPLEWEVFGYPLKITDADPLLKSKDPSNVWIKQLKFVDSSTGNVVWDSGEISPPVQTGTYADAMRAANLSMDVTVDWPDLEIWTYYTVEKVGPGGEWEPSPLGGYGSNSMIVVYTPSTNTQRAEMGFSAP